LPIYLSLRPAGSVGLHISCLAAREQTSSAQIAKASLSHNMKYFYSVLGIIFQFYYYYFDRSCPVRVLVPSYHSPRYCSMFAGVQKLVRNGKYMRARKDSVRGRRTGSHYECRFASIGRRVKLSATARSPVVMAAMPGPIQLVGLNTEYLPSLSGSVGGVAQW